MNPVYSSTLPLPVSSLKPMSPKSQAKASLASSKTISKVEHDVTNIVRTSVEVLGSVADDTNNLANIFRKLDKFVIAMAQNITSGSRSMHVFKETLLTTVAGIDAIQFATDINYFVMKKFKEAGQYWTNILAKMFFCVANTGSMLLWLHDMAFFNLSQIAARLGEIQVFSFMPKVAASIPMVRDSVRCQQVAQAIGETRIFSFMPKTSLVKVATLAADFGFGLMALDSLKRYRNAEKEVENDFERDGIKAAKVKQLYPQLFDEAVSATKKKALIDGIGFTSDVVIDSLIMAAGVTHVVGLGILACVFITSVIASTAAGIIQKRVKERAEAAVVEHEVKVLQAKKLEVEMLFANKAQ